MKKPVPPPARPARALLSGGKPARQGGSPAAGTTVARQVDGPRGARTQDTALSPRRFARPWLAALSGCILLAFSSPADADSYRLRGDTYAFGVAPAPAGLVTLSGQAKPTSWADAEAAVWLGASGGGTVTDQVGDVLVANVRLREPHGYGELRLGRMLVTAGAIRPLQLDGGQLTARIPKGPSLQVFGGIPVEPGFSARSYDWALGGRLSQRIGEYAGLGVSYLQRRGEGRIAFEELGFDVSASPFRWLDAAADVAVDMLRPAVTNGRASIGLRYKMLRLELFGVRRSPSRLLPATSLFSAIGDIPSDQAGAGLWVKAAPRLDVWAQGSADSIGGTLGGRSSLSATLRLDDRGNGAVGFELRRSWVPDDAGWTGGRTMLRLPLAYRFRAAVELELVFPDSPRGRGDVWPWGLVALGYSPADAPWLDVTAGVEASASPTREASVAGILRASAVWEKR